MKIRPTKASDVQALQLVIKATDMFPPEMLPEMIGSFLSSENCPELWLTCEHHGEAIGFCYAVPEEMTDGTWNMLAIGVLPAMQGKGVGRAIVSQLEKELRSQGQRILIADTSGTDEFANSREFYRHSGYTQEARIRDFWAPGDDKIVFWKKL